MMSHLSSLLQQGPRSGVALLYLWCTGCASAPPPKADPAPSSAQVTSVDSWRAQVPQPGPLPAFEFPAAQSVTLANGLRVLLLPQESRAVSLTLALNRGAAEDPAGKAGLAAITARLLTEGTTSRDAFALALAAENLGSSWAEGVTRDASQFSIELLTTDLPAGIALLAEMVQHPALRDADFRRVQAELKDAARSKDQDPMQLAGMASVLRTLGPDYGSRLQGSQKSLAAITLKDVRAFHRAAYAPDAAALVIVGNVSLEDGTALARQYLGRWSGKAAPPRAPLPDATPAEPQILLVDRPESPQTAVFASKRVSAGHNGTSLQREVVNQALGGLFGSRLNLNLREKNAFTYGVGSWLETTRRYGMFSIASSIETDVTGDALMELLKELRATSSGSSPLAEEEVTRSVQALTQELDAQLEQVSLAAPLLIEQFTEDLPLDYFRTLRADTLGQTPESVSGVVSDFREQGLTLVLVGDAAKLRQQLTRHGLIYQELTVAEVTE